MKISSRNVDRRSVLQTAAVGSVAMAVLPHGSRNNRLQNIRQRLRSYNNDRPGYIFIAGVVVSRESATRIQVMDTDAHPWQVEIGSGANVWKGRVQRGLATSVMVGDNVYVQGSRASDGLISASWVWDDIAWRRGRIAQVRDDGLVVATKNGNQFVNVQTLSPKIQTNGSDGGPNNGFRKGQYVEALGLSQKSGFSATLLLVNVPNEATQSRAQSKARLATLLPAQARHQRG